MPLQVIGRQMDVTPTQKGYITKKVERLRRLCPKFDELKFTLEKRKLDTIVDGSVRAGKLTAKASSTDPEPLAAIDAVIDKLELQLSKTKGKIASRKHQHRSDGTEELEAEREAMSEALDEDEIAQV